MIQSTRIPITSVAIDGDGYHIFMPLRIGQVELRALIDTGASRSVIHHETLQQLTAYEFLEAEDSQARGIGDQLLDTRVVNLRELKLGRLTIDEFYVGAIDLSHISATYEELGLEGFDLIIGGDLLHEYAAVINYEKSWIRLKRP